jgi:hypothetical protein
LLSEKLKFSMGSDEDVMRRKEPSLHLESLTMSTPTTNGRIKMTFSTPYKMRKFSEDSSPKDLPRNSLLLTPINNSAQPRRTSESQEGTLLIPSIPNSPLSFDGGSATATHQRNASTSQAAAAAAGIPIPAFMQPLLGLEFVPFVMPSVDESVEALTDKLLEELDVAGCPSYRRTGDEVSPLPASDATPLKTLDTVPPGSHLMLTNLNTTSVDPDNEKGALATNNEQVESTGPQEQTFEMKPEQEFASWSTTSERRRNVFQRRRTRSCGSSLKDSSSETDLKKLGATKESSTPRHKMKLRFMKKKPRHWKGKEACVDGCIVEGSAAEDPMEWLEKQQSLLQKHQSTLQRVQTEASQMQQQSLEIAQRVQGLQSEIAQLQKALEQSQQKLRLELDHFDQTRSNLQRLQQTAMDASRAVIETLQQMKFGRPCTPVRSSNNKSNRPEVINADAPVVEFHPAPSPPRQRAATAPTNADVFMNDVGLDLYTMTTTINDASSASSSVSQYSLNLDTLPSANEFVFVDHNLKSILQNLDQLGYDVATDESDRFVATSDTKKALKRYQKKPPQTPTSNTSWPIEPWYSVHGEDVLIWTGDVRHDGLGSDWPVCKARGLVNTSPRDLLEYLIDSSKVKEYNKMSQGREDLYRIQKGIDVSASESPYGIAGDCKIVKAINKPRLIPITIEMISLMHCKHLETIPGSYMMVYRSVFEDKTASGDATPVIRSEMLLGAVLVRPYNNEQTVCEMTSITHMYSPGVPEMIARRAAPSSAMSLVKDIQNIFKKD